MIVLIPSVDPLIDTAFTLLTMMFLRKNILTISQIFIVLVQYDKLPAVANSRLHCRYLGG